MRSFRLTPVIAIAIQLAALGHLLHRLQHCLPDGAGFLGNVAYFAFVVILGLLLQFFVVYSFFLATVAKTNPLPFYKQCREVTSTPSRRHPRTRLSLSRWHAPPTCSLPPKIARFVITVGASANQERSGLYEGVVVLFLAQVFNVDLTIGQQIQVVFVIMLAGVGTARHSWWLATADRGPDD